MNLTKEQLRILRHMLGINTPEKARPNPYRNYYCANKGDQLFNILAQRGVVEKYLSTNEYDFYRCTDEGRAAAINSFKLIRYSKARRRYIAFLGVKDIYPDLGFLEFITRPEFKRMRLEA